LTETCRRGVSYEASAALPVTSDMDGDRKVRRSVYFSGRVQGVGFRYTTCNVARRFAVTGFVRNLPDGRVEAVAEGDSEDIGAFLAEVEAEMGSHIRGVVHHDAPATREYGSFDIRF